jgi:energy-coupling factor transporter transmembrane protein EcfT
MEKFAMRERTVRQPRAVHAYQYRAVDSPIHRMPVTWKLLIGCLLSVAAFAARQPWLLVGLAVLNLTYYLLARLRLAELWRDIRFFLIQMAIIVVLYIIRFGVEDGIWPGVRTGLQILLFFLPGAVLLRTTQSSHMIRGLRRILPESLAFVIFTSLRFVPFFARELREITMAQRLRGAPLTLRQLANPLNWREALHCLTIPMVVRALKTAREAALSAEARGFGYRQEA